MARYDEKTGKHLADIQNRLYEKGFIGTHTKDLPQHITLGTFPTDRENELMRLVECVAQKTQSFDITFNHIGIFGGSKVLFIALIPIGAYLI